MRDGVRQARRHRGQVAGQVELRRSPRIVQCRAAQVAIVPQSQVRIASSAAQPVERRTRRTAARSGRGRRSRAPPCRRASRAICSGTSPGARVGPALEQRQQRRAGPPSASPTTGTSVGIRTPARVGSASICTTRALPGSGRCLVYGKFVPTISSVSQSSISSSLGRVPSSPMPADRVRRVVGDDRLAGQRLDDRRAQRVGDRQHLVAGVQRARARPGSPTLLARVEHLGRRSQVRPSRGQAGRRAGRPARSRRPGRGDVLVRVGAGVGDLDVVRDGQVGDAAPGVARCGSRCPPRRAAAPGCRPPGCTRRRRRTAGRGGPPAGSRCPARRSPACR